MSELVLVRHGRAAAAWCPGEDPGLDDAGRAQALAMAEALAPSGPRPIVVSPMRRTRETARPLELRWGVAGRVEPAVGEIRAAPGQPSGTAWLREVMSRRWSELPPEQRRWRQGVLDALVAAEDDSVVVTHFIAINVAVGEATGDDRVLCFWPDHCSLTKVAVEGSALRLLATGQEARTEVG